MFEESWVYAGEGGDVCDGYYDVQCKAVKVYDVPLLGKPKSYVRFLPQIEEAKDQPNLPFKVDPDGKTIRFGKDEKVRMDGVFGIDDSQNEISDVAAFQLVERLMNGTNGIVAVVGPQSSGKTYSLFGPMPEFRFQERGLFSRVLERLFWIADRSIEIEYIVRMGGLEIHQNRIRDLFTFLDIEGSEKSQCGMFFQRIVSPEHGLALLLTALAGQSLLPRSNPNTCANAHTLIYVDVIGRTSVIDPAPFNSRLIFTKFASVPCRDCCATSGSPRESCCSPLSLRKRCMREKNDPLNEAISIRQDLMSILHMCETAKKNFRLNKSQEVKGNRTIPISRFYAKSRLATILKGMASGKSEVRVLLCVRTEEFYKRASIEALRFGKVTRSVPIIINTIPEEFRVMRREMPREGEEEETNIFDEQEKKLAEAVPSDLFFALNPEVLNNLQGQITNFLAKEGLADEEQNIIGSSDVNSLYFKYSQDLTKPGTKTHRSLLLKADPNIDKEKLIEKEKIEKRPKSKTKSKEKTDKSKKAKEPKTKSKNKKKKKKVDKEKDKEEDKCEMKEEIIEEKKPSSPETCYPPELLAHLAQQKAVKEGREFRPTLECGQIYLGNNEKMSAVFMDVQGTPIVQFQGFTEPKKAIKEKPIVLNVATSTTHLNYCEGLVEEVIGADLNEEYVWEFGGEFEPEMEAEMEGEVEPELRTRDVGVGTDDDKREAERLAKEAARQLLRNKEFVKAGFPGLLGDLGLFCPWFEGKFGLVDDELSQELLLQLATLKENDGNLDSLLDEIYKMARKRAASLIPQITKKNKQDWVFY